MYYAAALAAFALPFAGPGSYEPGPITGAPTAIVTAAAAGGKTYGGHTQGGEPLVVRVRGHRVTTIVMQVHANCDSGSFFPATTTLGGGGKSTAPAIHGGRLSRARRFK